MSKADEINDCIRFERCDSRAECPCGVFGIPVDRDALYRAPCRMRHVRFTVATAGDDYIVAGVDEPRDEEGANVTGASDDDNDHAADVERSWPRGQCNATRRATGNPIPISWDKLDIQG